MAETELEGGRVREIKEAGQKWGGELVRCGEEWAAVGYGEKLVDD